jgi:hypothetical protein
MSLHDFKGKRSLLSDLLLSVALIGQCDTKLMLSFFKFKLKLLITKRIENCKYFNQSILNNVDFAC